MPVGVQCPISSSLGEFPSSWDWLWCPGLSPVLVSIAFPFLFQSYFFFTADVSPPIRSTLHLFTFYLSFQAWDCLWYPMLVVPEADQRCAWNRKLDPNVCPGRGRTLASSGRGCCH